MTTFLAQNQFLSSSVDGSPPSPTEPAAAPAPGKGDAAADLSNSAPIFPAAPRSKPYVAFHNAKCSAKIRSVSWELSLEQWCNIWRRSGKWEQRGTGQGYVMCRSGDAGPYSAGNVFIALARQNSSDHPNRKKNLPMGVFHKRKTFHAARKISGKRFYLGTYSTVEEAEAAYLGAAP